MRYASIEEAMRFKILVIDDEPILRDSLEVALKTSNYEVLTARTGEEGLEQFKKENPILSSWITGSLESTEMKFFAESRKKTPRSRSSS